MVDRKAHCVYKSKMCCEYAASIIGNNQYECVYLIRQIYSEIKAYQSALLGVGALVVALFLYWPVINTGNAKNLLDDEENNKSRYLLGLCVTDSTHNHSIVISENIFGF